MPLLRILRMWIKRLLLQWLTLFVVCFIMGILIKIHMSPSFLVIRNETVFISLLSTDVFSFLSQIHFFLTLPVDLK
jgi:hypothetical protein